MRKNALPGSGRFRIFIIDRMGAEFTGDKQIHIQALNFLLY